MSEAPLMRRIMLKLSDFRNVRIFRNNVGVALYPDGSRVKYGLCTGSSDLIGYASITVTPDMVGSKVAVFTAIETKTRKGKQTAQQKNFIEQVRLFGGIAGVARTEEEAVKIITEWEPA